MRQQRNGRVKKSQVLAAQEEIAAKIAAGVIDGVDYAALRRNAVSTSYVGVVEGDTRTLIEPLSGNAQDDAARLRTLKALGYTVDTDANNITASIPQAGHEAQVADQHYQYRSRRHFDASVEEQLRIANQTGSGELEVSGAFEDSRVAITGADFMGGYDTAS